MSIKLPGVPATTDETTLVYALGRMTIAWSSSEFYLALLLQRLMGVAALSTDPDIRRAQDGEAVMVVDMNAVFSLYYAVESSRGRRDLVSSLARARLGEGYLVQASFDAIHELLNDHAKIARSRNTYAHTAMGRESDGSYILLDEKLTISRSDWSARLRNPRIRTNNNKVHPKMVDDVTEKIEIWIGRALSLLRSIQTLPSPPQSPS